MSKIIMTASPYHICVCDCQCLPFCSLICHGMEPKLSLTEDCGHRKGQIHRTNCRVFSVAPVKVTISGHQHATAGETITLTCESTISNPPAIITWFARGQQLTGATSSVTPSPKVGRRLLKTDLFSWFYLATGTLLRASRDQLIALVGNPSQQQCQRHAHDPVKPLRFQPRGLKIKSHVVLGMGIRCLAQSRLGDNEAF